MCSNDNTPTATMVPYNTLKSMSEPAACTAAAAAYMSINPNLTQAALDHYRLQLYNYASYADRFRYTHPAIASHFALAATSSSPYGHHHHQGGHPSVAGHHHHHHPAEGMFAAAAALSPYAKFDPRTFRLHQEEPKPQHSYIGLIGMAILSSPDKKLVLSDIYQYILDNYAYFRSRGPGWRNSIRHNLSLNDCFIKSGRSANGKGHYWAIHPANLEDFKKGDFRRRKAQRRVRKHMGLAVPDDEDSTSPPPTIAPPNGSVSPNTPSRPLTPSAGSTMANGQGIANALNSHNHHLWNDLRAKPDSTTNAVAKYGMLENGGCVPNMPLASALLPILGGRRRQFDMESLLAPDRPSHNAQPCSSSAAAAMLRSVEAHHHQQQRNLSTSMFGNSVVGPATGSRYVQSDTVYPRRQSLINGGRLMMVQVPEHQHQHIAAAAAARQMASFNSSPAAGKDTQNWKGSNSVVSDCRETVPPSGAKRNSAISSPFQCAVGGSGNSGPEKRNQDGDLANPAMPTHSSTNYNNKRNINNNGECKIYQNDDEGSKKSKRVKPNCEVKDKSAQGRNDDTRIGMMDENQRWNGDEEERDDDENEEEENDDKNSCCSSSNSSSNNRTTILSPCTPILQGMDDTDTGNGSRNHSPAPLSANGLLSPCSRLSRDDSSVDDVSRSSSPITDDKEFAGRTNSHSPCSAGSGAGPFGSVRSGPAARALVCVAAAVAAAAQREDSSLSPPSRSAAARAMSSHMCHVTLCRPTLSEQAGPLSPWHKTFLHNGGGPTASSTVSSTPPLVALHHHVHVNQNYGNSGDQCSTVTTPGVCTLTSSPVVIQQGLPLGSSFSNDIQLSSISNNLNSSIRNNSSYQQPSHLNRESLQRLTVPT